MLSFRTLSFSRLSSSPLSFGKRVTGELPPLAAVAMAIVIHALFFFGMSRGAIQRATVVVSQGTGSPAVSVSLVAAPPLEKSNQASAEAPNEVPPAPEHIRKENVPAKEPAPAHIKSKVDRSKAKVEKKTLGKASAPAISSGPKESTARSDAQTAGVPSDTEHGGAGTPLVRGAPDYLVNPPPQYPAASRRLKEEGVVLLTVKISAEGIVTNVTIRQSSGFDRLDDAAIKAVQGWRFKPSRIGGMAVADTVEVPVRFALR